MGNCCRVITNLPIEEVNELVGTHPAVTRWGKNAIVPVSKSIFGLGSRPPVEITGDWVEVNLINTPNDIAKALNKECYIQDLDGYGVDCWFNSH
jgi:hypothetical protein